jgi:hypothetical protein
MPTVFRVDGLTEASIDSETHDISFVLRVSDGRGVAFVTEPAAARQIASSLGRVALDARQTVPMTVAAEKISKYGVKREAFGEAVLLQLVSDDGIPYMFALPLATADDIAARLLRESEKGASSGRA